MFPITKTYYAPLPVSEHPHILAVSFCHWHLLFSHTAPLLLCQWPPRQHQWHRLTWRRVWGITWYTQQCTMTGCNIHTQTRAAWVAKPPSSVTPYAIPTVDNFNVFQKYLRITCISVNTCSMRTLTKGLISQIFSLTPISIKIWFYYVTCIIDTTHYIWQLYL